MALKQAPERPYLPAPSAANFPAVSQWQASLIQALNSLLSTLGYRINRVLPKDGTEVMTGPIVLLSATVATVPTASEWTAGMLFVTDEVGGATPAFSDGTNWRRTADRAIIA